MVDELYETVINRLSYNPIIGKLYWENSPSNTALIGKIAGCTTVQGYIEIMLNNVGYKAHRLAWLYMYGVFPLNEIDHIDGDRSNNSILNLREVTLQENMKNKKKYCTNTSGVPGVNYHRQSHTWRARIGDVLLGYFKDKDLAVTKRQEAEVIYGYHKNHGRSV